MVNSRDINDLHPHVAKLALELKAACALEGIEIIFTQTLRDSEYQDWLYAQGRTRAGKVVTNARGGSSMHNFGLAFDVVPLDDKRQAIWDDKSPLWARIGAIGKRLGLEWGGDWKSFKDLPHFQYTQGLTLSQLRQGATLKV